MRSRGWKQACIALVLMAGRWACADGLQILTDEIPPMAFTQDGKPTGFCVTVVQEIQRRIHDSTPIQFIPWSRAYQMGVRQENVVLVCPKRTPEREALFQWVGPLLVSETHFYAKKGSGLQLHDLAQAKAMGPILVPASSYALDFLKGEGFQNLEPVNTSESIVRMLLLGRRPLMVMDRQQMPTLLEQAHVSPDAVEVVYRVVPTRAYLTFPKDAPEALVAQWQGALNAMKRDGTFARIHQQWFPGEPVPRRSAPVKP